MQTFKSVDEALDFAIKGEEESVTFYTGLADRMDKPEMKEVFHQFAAEEKGHKSKLEAVKKGKLLLNAEKKVADLKIGDYLVDVKPSADMDYAKALVLAMKKEKAAFRLYSDLAASAQDQGLRETFLALAQEEAKHKLRFEIEYDEQVLTEN